MGIIVKRTIALAVTVMFVLAACASKQPTKETAAPAADSTTPPSAQKYQTVVALKEAAVAAGLSCPAWNQDNVVQAAAESGNCSDDTVLSTYVTDADLQFAVRNMQDMGELLKEQNIPDNPILVGPNWIINAPTADKLADVLGGIVDR